jgi:peptide chain release factor subunit 1
MAANTITRGRLRRLAELRPDHGRVLTVFLNLDPAEFGTAPARATAINSVMTEAARAAEQQYEALSHDQREALEADIERVRGILEGPDIANDGARAVGVFACGLADVLEVVQLPYPTNSRAVVNSRPFLEPLIKVGEPERYCVILVNRRAGRLFFGAGDQLEETDRVQDDTHQQHDQGGWSQARYQRSVEKEKIDHLDHVAEIAFDRFKNRPFDRLVVGAPEELVHQFEERLHPYVRERLTARVVLDVENSNTDAVRGAAAAVIEEAAKRHEAAALDRMRTGLGQAARGTAGLADTLAALNEMRVEILLLQEGLRAPGYLDPEASLVSAEPLDGFEAVDDVVEPAMERAIEQSAEVLFVRHHPDLGPHGGIGAVLRF